MRVASAALFFALFGLTGCASPQEMSRQECETLGMKFGTPEFANCYEQAMARRQSVLNAAAQN